MKFTPHELPFNARNSDDPYHRIQMQAEKRALRNGRDPTKAGRDAMAMLKLLPDGSVELILQVVSGEFKRAA